MDFRFLGFDNDIFKTIQHVLDVADETEKPHNAPSRAYVRDSKAMASTPANIKEYPNNYQFIIDMLGVKATDIKVQVEDNVLHVSGERKRKEKEDAKFIRMECRVGKFMRKFVLPKNADTEVITANYQDSVLIVTVEKLPPLEPKKAKNIKVKVN